MTQPLTIALSKGRILDDTLPLLAEAGIHPAEDIHKSRKLIFDTNHAHIKLVVIRATDVPTYVEYGAADLGVAGKDVLMEYGSDNLCEPLDLDIARCRLMTAALKDFVAPQGRLKVATKFVNVAKRYFAEQGRQVDIIKLYGGMEAGAHYGAGRYDRGHCRHRQYPESQWSGSAGFNCPDQLPSGRRPGGDESETRTDSADY